MKKLAALASMVVLLCASASFAKKAMDEGEMDKVTAAGQPDVQIVNVSTADFNRVSVHETDTTAQATINAGGDSNGIASGGEAAVEVDALATSGGLDVGVDVGFLFPLFDAGADIDVDFASADIGGFSLSIEPSTIGTLSATSSATTDLLLTGATATVTADQTDNTITTVDIESGSQSNLRAVVLNNVAGENQLASGINIQSGTGSAGGDQSNSITQSWGSTFDWTFAEGIATATAAAGDGGDGGSNSIEGVMNPCVVSECSPMQDSQGGPGGFASASAEIPHLPLTIHGDKIQHVTVDSTGDAAVDVVSLDKALVTLAVREDSQTNLAAIVVNNVAGRNQVAQGVNVTTEGAAIIGSDPNNADVGRIQFDAPVTGSGAYSGGQSNTIHQFRGTPYNQQP
jgi:hypothetical protein